jgi:hypothetical protein
MSNGIENDENAADTIGIISMFAAAKNVMAGGKYRLPYRGRRIISIGMENTLQNVSTTFMAPFWSSSILIG